MSLHFLAGVIDGDGTYRAKAHRVNIYCGKPGLLDAVVVACLRLGIVPSVSRNRTIANVQIVERLEDLGKYTRRIKPTGRRVRQGTRFFSARQLLDDIVYSVNRSGKILRYVESNLLIDASKIEGRLLRLASASAQGELRRLLDGDIRQQRGSFVGSLGVHEVYNITVADNHNYVVFSDGYSPLLVNNCHAAIISRELGVPCVVGTNDGTRKVKSSQKVTVSCAEGEDGKVYEGILKFKVTQTKLASLPKTKTKVMLNVGNPDEAFDLSFLPSDGVGLAREEFIINSSIGIHPMALLHPERLTDDVKRAIEEKTHGYKDKTEFFIDKLSQGIATIASAFYPRDVILRFSDFKTNEYANLLGGTPFEPQESNPMIGWRGASRYYKDGYKEGFALECQAIKRVRDVMGLTNVKVMVPTCRTVEEGKKVIDVMAKNGLRQGKMGLQVYVMCEIPSNALLAERFLEVFDGFSIGSNDLTQMTLGVDRDSDLVADIFSEKNDAVKMLISMAIGAARKAQKKIGICGQAPSDYPDFAAWLVRERISSISLNPDAFLKTLVVIAETERRMRYA